MIPDEPRIMPGDMVVALRPTRGWESELSRGTDGMIVNVGSGGLVLETWPEGGRLRLRLLLAGRIIVVSCKAHNVLKNWTIAAR
jgi:hypothetical protein